jgi:hypothetical protein
MFMHRSFHASLSALIAAFAFTLLAAPAFATFHLFRIQQLYSNADGTIQFIVLRESFGQNGEHLWKDHAISAGSAAGRHSYTFPGNLPSDATANKYVLVATEGFAALNLITPDYVVPNNFLWTVQGNVNFADVDFISYSALPTDGVGAFGRNKTVIPNVATNFAGQSASVTAETANGGAAVAKNYQGLWWNAPADSESGWGINFAHQGDVIFATWFTYDTTGKAWWLAMTANKTADATYTGTLFDATGPAFGAVPFDSAKFKPTAVGTGTVQFSDENNGTFSYTVNGIAQTKAITRQVFAAVPKCTSAAKLDPATATNYQDLWWNAPADSESGWGINLTHQGDVIFATWFTYDTDGKPMWLSVTAFKSGDRAYSGDLARTTGPAFNAVPFDSKSVAYTKVGTAAFTFTSGKEASFAYTVNGVSGTKTIMREVFVAPGTVCQ